MGESHSLLTWLPCDLVNRKLHLSHYGLLHTGQHAIGSSTEGDPDVLAENCQEHFLTVGTMDNFLDKVNATVLWALSAEIL